MQLQLFLQQMIPVMEDGIALMAPLAVLMAILYSMEDRKLYALFRRAAYWGFWGSLFIMAVKQGTRNAVSREGFEGLMAVLCLLGEGCMAFFLFRGGRSRKAASLGIKLLVPALIMYYGMEIWLVPVTALVNKGSSFTADTAYRLLGAAAGLLAAFITSWLIYRSARALRDQRLRVVFFIQIFAVFILQVIYLIQILMARHILPMRSLIRIMAPVINHQQWLVFAVLLVVFAVPLALFSQKRPERPARVNPAVYRKMVAGDIHKKRWGKAAALSLLLVILLSGPGSIYANKKEELVPAVSVQAVNGRVALDIGKVNDGHLHRFSYFTKGGRTVRFIVILKGGSAYGVGLDACEICGPTGYIERDGQVVCRLCDVMMNKATIGMPGGCNPIPLAYGVEDGKIVVKQDDLDKAETYFR